MHSIVTQQLSIAHFFLFIPPLLDARRNVLPPVVPFEREERVTVTLHELHERDVERFFFPLHGALFPSALFFSPPHLADPRYHIGFALFSTQHPALDQTTKGRTTSPYEVHNCCRVLYTRSG